MPSKPSAKATSMTSDTVKILNTVRSYASQGYADSVPLIVESGVDDEVGRMRSLDNIRYVGTVLAGMPNLMNEFFNIINRIAFAVIKSANFYNRLSLLKKGYVDYGETIEEIFVEMANSNNYDINKSPTSMLAPVESKTQAVYYTMNYQHFYQVTIYPYQMKQLFTTYDGVGELISYIIKSALTAADLDEFIVEKYMIARTALDGKIQSEYMPVITKDNGSDAAKKLIVNADLLTYVPQEYNIAGVANGTPISKQVIIGTSQFKADINVDVLAPAFNMDKTELVGRILSVNNFSFSPYEMERLNALFANDVKYTPFTPAELNLLKTIQCFQCSEDWFQIYDNLTTQREFENGENLYRNMWFHFWKTFAISPFENAILYSSTQSGITSVTITPSTASVNVGQSALFKASMVTTGFASKAILWEVSGDGITSTISQDGLLTVGQNETAKELTVKATSIADPTKSATATVTVVS